MYLIIFKIHVSAYMCILKIIYCGVICEHSFVCEISLKNAFLSTFFNALSYSAHMHILLFLARLIYYSIFFFGGKGVGGPVTLCLKLALGCENQIAECFVYLFLLSYCLKLVCVCLHACVRARVRTLSNLKVLC